MPRRKLREAGGTRALVGWILVLFGVACARKDNLDPVGRFVLQMAEDLDAPELLHEAADICTLEQPEWAARFLSQAETGV